MEPSPDTGTIENGVGLRISAPPPAAAEPLAAELPQAAESDWAEERLFRVVLNLANDEWVEVGSFVDEASADAHAREIASRLSTTTEWPKVRGRYLRPETILSIEISERKRLGGSQARAAWGQTGDR